MRKHFFFSLAILVLFASCTKQDSGKKVSFYHWKSHADYPEAYQKAIETTNANRIYLHYFDIEQVHEPNWNNDGIFPTYVLKSVATDYKGFDIVPVVYLTNQVLKTEELDLISLSDKIKTLVNQISQKQFERKISKIQMDCDWTESSRNAYFELLNLLQDEFEIDATIRLHQIKFKDKTGIPPVKSGTLMLYNVGDLKNKKENSILESATVNQYINSETDYPLQLNVGLPLFSQTVIFNNDDQVKIIRNTEKEFLENDAHFQKVDEFNFKVVEDILYKGFYLTKGFQLKLEQVKESEIITSYQLVKESKLNLDEVIFYHLDEASFTNVNLKEIIDQL